MKRNKGGTRRAFLGSLCVLPMSVLGVRSEAQSRQLKLLSYSLSPTPAHVLARKVAEGSAGMIQVSIETTMSMPHQGMSTASALAHYCTLDFASVEPVLGLSTLPMLTATFNEAETLLRIARPHYDRALARHGQILLATEPSRPTALWSNIPIRLISDLKGISFAYSTSLATRMGGESTFVRLGARHSSYSDAEVVLSDGYAGNNFAQEFAYFTEISFAAPLTFLTASQEAFHSLNEVQRQVLVAAGRDAELALWKLRRESLVLDQQDIAARGTKVTGEPPADVLVALRAAAEPDIQRWAQAMGADGAAILAEYRRAIGRD